MLSPPFEEAQAVADIGADILMRGEGSYGPAAGDPNTTLSITVEGSVCWGPIRRQQVLAQRRVPEAEFKFSNLSPDAANITIDGLAFVAPSPAARSVLMGGNFDGLTVVNNTFTGGRNAVLQINKGGNHNIANNLITDPRHWKHCYRIWWSGWMDRGSNSRCHQQCDSPRAQSMQFLLLTMI